MFQTYPTRAPHGKRTRPSLHARAFGFNSQGTSEPASFHILRVLSHRRRSFAICGIAGIVDYDASPARALVDTMTATVAHRGPDLHAIVVDGPAGLGHRRLAIIDLSPRGNQPMTSADGRFTIVFNGEVYNFRALRAGLERRGEHFASDSDTEVVLTSFRRDGVACFRELNGMFAVAIWDRERQELTLARDRFGQKPLYVWSQGNALVFGSEIKVLLASGRVERRLDWQALHEYCYYGNALGRRTLFAGIRRLEAGHWLRFSAKGTDSAPFWRVDDVRPVADDVDTATARVRSLLEASVERHLESDVPIGSFLSGGIDSSAVTTLAARRSGARIATYSVAFDDRTGELPMAKMVADRAGTEHHEVRVRGANIEATVRALVRHHDLPFGDAANIPLYLLARELEGRLKVVLQGDGGDEVFAGYRRYNVLAFSKVWQLLARGAPLLDRMPVQRHQQRLRRFLRAIGEREPGRMMGLMMSEEPDVPAPTRLLAPEVRAQLGTTPFARYEELAARLAHLPPVQKMLHTDCAVLLPDHFCEKVDRATMAFGLEVRLPFLDNELTDYVLGLPWQYKVRRLQKKWLLRRALRGTVPDAILDAPKQGFGVPYGDWLRGPLKPLLQESVLSGAAARDGVLDRHACERTIAAHDAGLENHGFLLYKMCCFAIWYEDYLSNVEPIAGQVRP